MAIPVYFNNKKVVIPGAYSTIISGESNPPRILDYGRCLIIDTGVLGKDWGGGSGINGQLASGSNSVYTFTSLEDFQSFIKGGYYWKLAEALFLPDKSNPAAVGVSELCFVRAATTTSALMTFSTEGGGTFKVLTRDEGTVANGVVTTGPTNNGPLANAHLDKGYAYLITPGSTTGTYIMQFWVGSFTGLWTDNIPFNEESKASSKAKLLVESPEFNNLNTLIEWASSSTAFNTYFKLDESSTAGSTGAVTSGDVTAAASFVAATGGTADYGTGTAELNDVLPVLSDYAFNAIITDQYGQTNYNSSLNQVVFAYNASKAKFPGTVFVGLGEDKEDFTTLSLAGAKSLDSCLIAAVHGGVGTASSAVGDGYRWWDVMYNLCSIVGRCYGKAPQIPVTNKTIGVAKLKHRLTDDEIEKAIQAGLLVTVYNTSLRRFVVALGTNTFQDNQILFDKNGQSFSLQMMRIIQQINHELVVNAEIDLLGDENGVNSNTLSAGILKNWTEDYLQSRTATTTQDNLILSFRNVNVTKTADYYNVTYGVVVNNEINKIFFTGFLFRQ